MKHNSMNNRIWLLLIACSLVFMGISLGIGDTYARYISEKSVSAIYEGTNTWTFLEPTNIIEEVSPATVETEKSEDVTTIESESEDEAVSETENENTGGIEVIYGLNAESPIILKITYPNNCTKVVLNIKDSNFEEGTIYSTDGSKGYQLNDSGGIAIDVTKSKPEIVLISVPNTVQVIEQGNINIEANFYAKTDSVIGTTIEVTQEINPYTWKITQTPETSLVLGSDASLTWKKEGGISGESYKVKVERLTESGTYVSVDNLQSLTASVTTENGVTTITVSNRCTETLKAQAGTYRLVVTNGYETATITFLVNYSS